MILDEASGFEDSWVPTFCYCCVEAPCLIKVHTVNGVAIDLEPNVEGEGFIKQAKNQGRICPKPYGLLQKLYNPYRFKAPLKRTNPEKGIGINPKWVEVSWDEALALVAEKLGEIRMNDPRRLLIDGSRHQYYTLEGTAEAFYKAFGPVSKTMGVVSNHCDACEHSFGNIIHGAFACEPDLDYCNYLLLLGSNYAASGGAPENVQFANAQARGMKIVAVDPVLTVTAAKADEWLPIKPGTDMAFMLALINVIINEIGVYDVEFLKNMTNAPYLVGPDGCFVRHRTTNKVVIWDVVEGKEKEHDDASIKDFALEGIYIVDGVESRPAFQMLKEHVREYTPEWASSVTHIAPNTIRSLAK